MADPVDEIIDSLNPPADPPADPPASTATIEKAELARLQEIAKKFDQVAPTLEMLERNPALIHDLRAKAVEQAATPPADAPDEFWIDPKASAKKAAMEVMAPAAAAMQEQLVELALQNFKATLSANPYYHVAMPLFDKKLSGISKAWLGSQRSEIIYSTFQEAWNAAVGEYSNQVTTKRMAERAAASPPANLGGGGGGPSGGPKEKKSLQELDPIAYAMAKQAGLSDEDIQSIADQGDE